MSQACQICNHPKRLVIDRKIVAGGNLSKIAKEYGVSYGSLYGHAQNHITRQLSKAMEIKATNESMGLLNRIEAILVKAEDIFNRNYDKGRDGLALKALSEQRSTIELLSKIAAYLHEARAAELQAAQQEREPAAKIDASCLNDRELITLHKLLDKVMRNDPSLVVLRPLEDKTPFKPVESTDFPSPYKDIPRAEIIDSSGENSHSTPVYEDDSAPAESENPLAVKREPYSTRVRPLIR